MEINDATSVKTPRARQLLVLAVVLLVGLFVGHYLLPGGGRFAPSSLQFVSVEEGRREVVFPTFWEAWDELHEKFITKEELTEKKLFYGAVSGMIRAAGDPYTMFADPEETKQFEETIEGSFSGIGIEVGMRNGLITVIAPLSESPAEKAGIREGDIVVAVDGAPVAQEDTLDHIVSKIRGPRGTKVKLTVVHEDSRETEEIEIVRDRIEVESVKTKIEDGVALLTITNFNGDTSQRFDDAVKQAVRAGVTGIIVDVRNNPGGYLQSSVDIASHFIPAGKVVVSERGTVTREYTAMGRSVLNSIPLVVVINGGSASASEILAGALHDHLDAPLVGEKTFGKGSVQEFIKLNDGSSMRVTVAKWFTPNGKNIDEEGIAPTVEIEQNDETDADEQLDKAREVLNELRTKL